MCKNIILKDYYFTKKGNCTIEATKNYDLFFANISFSFLVLWFSARQETLGI